jgi:hypothetical protein
LKNGRLEKALHLEEEEDLTLNRAAQNKPGDEAALESTLGHVRAKERQAELARVRSFPLTEKLAGPPKQGNGSGFTMPKSARSSQVTVMGDGSMARIYKRALRLVMRRLTSSI